MHRFLRLLLIRRVYLFKKNSDQIPKQTAQSMPSDRERTTFESEQIEPLLEEAKAKRGGSLPNVEVGEANLHRSHSL